MFKPCLLIPVYNHGPMIDATLAALKPFGLPCLLVDDGSDADTARTLDAVSQRESNWISLFRLPQNGGKGAAVSHGLRQAQSLGFSHALQIDADGQHDSSDVPAFLAAAEREPDALISGAPQYGDDMPRSRRYGRWITHVWVWIETLSFDIRDSMCGFRVYPVAACVDLLDRQRLGQRMTFDIEILVRLHWAGVPMRFLPTQVRYPENGISHFRTRDNLQISALHSRLFVGMLWRSPKLLMRRWRQRRQRHWSDVAEAGSYWGIRLMFGVYRHIGRWFFSLLLYPVMAYFWLAHPQARQASRDFLQRVAQGRADAGLPALKLSSFRHFMQFGHALLDRLAAFSGAIPGDRIDCPNSHLLQELLDTKQGAMLLSSHLGNADVTQANYAAFPLHFVALAYLQNTDNFNRVLARLRPNAPFDLVSIAQLDSHTGLVLQQHIDDGHVIVTAADRTPAQARGRTVAVPFLGGTAHFPEGPFLIASLLDCPVYLFYCFRNGSRHHIHIERFADTLAMPRRQRREQLPVIVARYAARLEYHALRHPEQWFNFFDFWAPAAADAPPTPDSRPS